MAAHIPLDFLLRVFLKLARVSGFSTSCVLKLTRVPGFSTSCVLKLARVSGFSTSCFFKLASFWIFYFVFF